MPTFAAVDIGSNSVRLKIAKLVRDRLQTLHEDREVTRLGEAVFRTSVLSPQAMERTVAVLRRFHRATQTFAVDGVRVVATSATRAARNSAVLREWVRAATGWTMEVVSGLEEGRLIHLGVLGGSKLRASSILLIDLGGGSCELTLSREGHIRQMVSLPLGAVRLTQEFLQHDPPKKKELERLREFVGEEVARTVQWLERGSVEITLATSGTAAALDALYRSKRAGARTVPAAAVTEMAQRLGKLGLRQRRDLAGIGPRRAEIIVAGAVVFARLLGDLRLPSLRYSPLGLRDGLLAQMAAEYSRTAAFRKQIVTERLDAVLGLCRHYAVDLKHAARVRAMAEQLFRALKSVHKLPAEYEEWMAAAAMLYETGAYVNHSGRHRHAHYIISHSEIFGYSVAQRHTIAAIARYMGRSRPAPQDAELRMAPAGERAHIAPAVVLLRLAAALDQARNGNITAVRARIAGDSVRLELKARRSPELEQWALQREAAYFRAVFGRELVSATS